MFLLWEHKFKICFHSQEMKQIGYGRMHGIPLVATSPVRNDESPINLHGFEVTSFQPQWKMISELAMHADSKNNGMHPMHSPAYQDIVNQVWKWDCELSFIIVIICMIAQYFFFIFVALSSDLVLLHYLYVFFFSFFFLLNHTSDPHLMLLSIVCMVHMSRIHQAS